MRITRDRLQKISNCLLSVSAGIASFVFTLIALLVLAEFPEKILAAITMGTFALLIVWIAAERPNTGHARAVSALMDRLLAVGQGDLTSPAPPALKREMPALAAAVDTLFEQVRFSIDNVHELAMYDPVTTLPNRVHFKREAEGVLQVRPADGEAALLFIDLDGFKEVNDSLGHAQGDQVLAMVADRLRIVVNAESVAGAEVQPVLARLAGDEFTLLFPAVNGAADAERIAASAHAALAEPFQTAGNVVDIGASIGIALSPAHGADLTSLMKAADIAMYHAKASGRSQVCLYSDSLANAFAVKGETEAELRNALLEEQFSLVYQPLVCARTGEVIAGEALLRWNHPVDGLLLPGSFIPIAEESTLIVAIGEWVVKAVVASLGRWRDAGMTQRLTFNVSPGQLERPGFFARLRRAMEQAGSPPWLLELEFTEATAMRCSDVVKIELAALRSAGVAVSIDDFGSGYSNLSRMKDIPLDRVKLDRCLVHDVDTSESARTIVASLIHLIHGLGLEVVAEGVERSSQIEVLRAIGCDVFQGYAFAEPMLEARFFEWIASAEAVSLRRSA